MIKVTLDHGRTLEEPEGITAAQALQDLGVAADHRAVAASVDGELLDLARTLDHDCTVAPVWLDSPLGLEIMRHSAAHVMAEAVRSLFPGVKVAIGPAIEAGFYYDFDVPEPFTPEDLTRIEARMAELVGADLPFKRREVSKEEALGLFRELGEEYKVELLEEIPADFVSLYRQGDFVDLCRGPHVPSTGFLKAFKLTHVSGAYWRGDEKRTMLQRL